MQFAIKPFTEDLIPAVKNFNSRLDAGGAPPEFRFPEHPAPQWLPKLDNRRIYQEYFLLVHNNAVRGAYVLKHQDFSLQGNIQPIAYFHWPISEGMVNRTYAWVALQMLRSLLQAHPLIYGLGIGGYDAGPLPRMLKAVGWSMCSVPFHFKVNYPARFLREIRVLRNTAAKRLMMEIAARTGTGGLGLRILQGARTKRGAGEEGAEVVRAFSCWADELWQECKGRYAMIAVRDCETLNILYPADGKRFLCYKITRGDAVLGWAVLLDTPMRDHKYFGNMRVGSIVDCLGLPENASAVIRAATGVLEERGVDLIVSNQSHHSWSAALRDAGFLRGPSNFLFGASKELSKLLHPFHATATRVHMTRGDGDGPIHL